MNIIKRILLVSLLLPISALTAACPGGEDQPPVADGGTGTGAGSSSAASADETADSGEEACVENPVEPVELLNGCTDASCQPFSNTPDRLPLLQADGSLPPIP